MLRTLSPSGQCPLLLAALLMPLLTSCGGDDDEAAATTTGTASGPTSAGSGGAGAGGGATTGSASGGAGSGGGEEGFVLGDHGWPPPDRHGGATVCACVEDDSCPDPGASTLPMDKPWAETLRLCLSTFTSDDFTLAVDGALPLFGTDPELPGYFASDDSTYRLWMLAHGAIPGTKGLRVAPEHFTLEAIEGTGQILMSCGRRGWFSGVNTQWFNEWQHPANPYFGSLAVSLRTFVACAVDLIMRDKATANGSWVRSDMLGASLSEHAYVYGSVKEILPPKVRAAFEAGLLDELASFETKTPSGSGGGDMEMIQLVGLYELGRAVPTADVQSRVSARVKQVLDYQFEHLYFEKHGGFYDPSYEGIALHVLGWAASASGDAGMLEAIDDASLLKAYSTLPEPDGQYFGPTNFATATADDAVHDQWARYSRDSMLAMLSPAARYLVYTPRQPSQNPTPEGVLPSVEAMQAAVVQQIGAASNTLKTLDTSTPGVWDNVTGFAADGYQAAYSYYRPGFYAYLRELEAENSEQMRPPFAREGSFIERFGDHFTIAKLGDYGAIIHHGGVATTWASGVSGKSGGSLAALWTEATGSVILGRSRGTQGPGPDTWSGERGWDSWAVHAISGLNAADQPFSSARWRNPVLGFDAPADDRFTIFVDGWITSTQDSGWSAPNNAITGQVAYQRVFELAPEGLTITSSLITNASDSVKELWEMVPVFLKSDLQTEAVEATIDLQVGGAWEPATTTLSAGVTAVRIQRFSGAVYLVFEEAQAVRLSPRLYTGTFQADKSRIQNLQIDLLGSGGQAVTIPAETGVKYTIQTAAP